MKIIARMRSEFKEKEDLPRQGRLFENLTGKIVFEKEFSSPDYIKGIEKFSHLYVIWEFSDNLDKGYKSMTRPRGLEENEKVGVFATRSPFRPSSIGLSIVKIEKIERENNTNIIYVKGIDMLDNSPIYDIKPYIPSIDRVEEATIRDKK